MGLLIILNFIFFANYGGKDGTIINLELNSTPNDNFKYFKSFRANLDWHESDMENSTLPLTIEKRALLLLFSALILYALVGNPISNPTSYPASSSISESAGVEKTSEQFQAPDNFYVIALADTQFYFQTYPKIFDSQTRWIADNVADLNIKFVIHQWDIINSSNVNLQWQRANHSLNILEGKVPWAVLPGNHDGTSVGTPSENLTN
jgi:hypothetical protein